MHHRHLVSVFYKQQPERATIDQLLHPEHLRPGERFTRVFQREMEFLYPSTDDVLDELFATFNGHGKALPPNTLLPRSICVGDIIVIDQDAPRRVCHCPNRIRTITLRAIRRELRDPANPFPPTCSNKLETVSRCFLTRTAEILLERRTNRYEPLVALLSFATRGRFVVQLKD